MLKFRGPANLGYLELDLYLAEWEAGIPLEITGMLALGVAELRLTRLVLVAIVSS